MSLMDRKMQFVGRHAPTTCKNLIPSKGAGFILCRLADKGPLTRRGVYTGTKYEKVAIKDGKFVSGYHSLLWSWLRDNKYISVESGNVYDTFRHAFNGRTQCTAVGGKEPVYGITDAGLELVLGILLRNTEYL